MEASKILKDLDLEIGDHEFSRIYDRFNAFIGYHSSIISKKGLAISGGFGRSLEIANKIALSEYIERSIIYKYNLNEHHRKEWYLTELPTACGFAVGFDRENTIIRSLCEAVERLALSRWIDERKPMKGVRPKLSKSAQYFASQFEEVEFYKTQVPVSFEDEILVVFVGVSICYTKEGAYLGSRAALFEELLWDHALLESFRHLLIVRNTPQRSNFPYNRILYFSKNKNQAKESIVEGEYKQEIADKVKFFRVEKIADTGPTFLARTVLSGWNNWADGPVERFLY